MASEKTTELLTTASAGGARLAVIGQCPVSSDRLQELSSRLRSPADVDGVFRALAGSAYLIAAVDGQVQTQGSISGLHVLFHASLRGAPVAADRADLLAAITGSQIDDEVLALRVVCGGLLASPAGDRSLWSGVSALPPGHRLLWSRQHGERTIQYWQPPVPELSMTEGAAAVRSSLEAATRRHQLRGGRLSTDLSGGMDSTSLAFLVAPRTPDLLTFRWGEAEVGNDDATYARHAIEALDGTEHLVLAQHENPRTFADPTSFVDLEQPHPITRTLARAWHGARHLVEHGSRQHLAGHGGDELFSPMHGYLHQLLRRRPITALRHVRAYAALRRWPLLPSLTAIARPGDPAGWWHAQADHLTESPPSFRQPIAGWGLGALRAQEWIPGDALDLCRAGLRRAAEEARPLAADPGRHQMLLLLRSNALHYRLLGRLYARAGTELELPFYDDRVVDAVLSVPQADHAGPWQYKPLLAEAMQGIVPDRILRRSTKGEFGEDVRIGLRANLPAILDVFADSELARRGLIDPSRLRSRLTGPQQDNRAILALESLLGCENWVRAAATESPHDLGRLPDHGIHVTSTDHP